MATDKGFVDYVVYQAGLGSALTTRKMFGEYGFYHDGKLIALACDNSLYIKASSASRELASGVPQRPPYPGAKSLPVVDELLDEGDTLRALLLATSAALPLPKPKPPRRPRNWEPSAS